MNFPLILLVIVLSGIFHSCGENFDQLTGEEEEEETLAGKTSEGGVVSTGQSASDPATYQGSLNALFIGHSAMNDIVADHVAESARKSDPSVSLGIAEATTESITLQGKKEFHIIRDVFAGGSHQFDFVIITEAWDYQNYHPQIHGEDLSTSPTGCPGQGYSYVADWTAANEWYYTPYYLQKYRDVFVCSNSSTKVLYYQTWSLGYNEVENGLTRVSDPGYSRPEISDVQDDILRGRVPDLPLADRITYEGVKWLALTRAAKRNDLIFIPAAFALADLMRHMEQGVVPGFEDIADRSGLNAEGQVPWADFLFYQDQYHLGTLGHYFMSLVIYSSMFNKSPEGLSLDDSYKVSEYFPEDQFPLYGITDAEYQKLLSETNLSGIDQLRGKNNRHYIHDSLRLYLQKSAWEAATSITR